MISTVACEGQTPHLPNHLCAFIDWRDETCNIQEANQREAQIPVTMETAKLNLGPDPWNQNQQWNTAGVCQVPAPHDVFHFPFPLVKIDTHWSGVVTPEAAL